MATSISANAAIITGTTTIDEGIVVTEGTKQIGDGSTTTEIDITGSDADGNAIYVAGSNAEIIVNNAKIKAAHDICIGSSNSNGSLIVDNGSTLDMSAGATLVLGYVSYGDGFGDLTVKGGSTLIGGHNNFWIFNGTLNAKDAGTKVYLASTNNGTNYNYRTLLGYFPGNTANINVSNGAEVVSSATQFVANYYGNTTVNINVTGEGSKLTQTELTVSTIHHYDVGASGEWKWMEKGDNECHEGWYDANSSRDKSTAHRGEQGLTVTYLCDSGTNKNGWKYDSINDCTTTITATDGGRVEFQSKITYIGSMTDRQNGCTNKLANLFTDDKSSISFQRLDIYADTNITSAGGITINSELNVYGGCTLTFNLTKENLDKAVISLTGTASANVKDVNASIVEADKDKVQSINTVTFNINGASNMKAGQRFILFNKELQMGDGNTNQRATTTPALTINIIGTDAELTIVDGQTVITLLEDIFVGRDPLADVLGAAAWGVQKSSQAFTGTLRGGRTNAVVLNTCTSTSSDEKGNVVSTTQPTGRTIAWGTAYGQFSEIDSCCDAAGADYNIYGAAIGAEHQFASGRSIGAALGYDWGKVSPFHAASFDQESKHAAIYGRAGQWKLGTQGALAVDLSAAVGQTESELPVGDVEQDSLQLDARVSYIYALTDKTSISAFAGLQYYAQSDDSTANVEVGSAQYLRSLAGVGINHAVTAQTTVFAEASVYNDAMRHNPEVMVDGFTYGVANPGRLGGSITAGAAYELNANWTLRGSYSFDAAKHSTEHSVNAGAVYKF